MAHSLITGMTETGKTTLARGLCLRHRQQGFFTGVLDPLLDPRWAASYITDDGDEFLERIWRSESLMLFLDEGSESVGRYDTAMQKTATRGRHWGHSCHYICQSAIQIAPIIRDQCTHVFCFASGRKAAKTLAEEFNAPDLELAVALKQGEYFHAIKGGSCTFVSTKRRYENAHFIDIGGRGVDGHGTRRAVEEKQTGSDDGDGETSDVNAGGSGAGPRGGSGL